MDYLNLHFLYKENTLLGRYITLENIAPLLNKLDSKNEVKIIGKSVLDKPIYGCQIGSGKTRILLWSQMHGNESTTTKALFDLFNFLNAKTELQKKLLHKFTFYFIPMLNPDGAECYTRENANKIDLNRDAQNLSQPESIILRSIYDQFKPDFCYNLHDQRTIFGVGTSNKPATVSFLAPTYNVEREVNAVRLKAINLIVAMNTALQRYIPGQVGRFDDEFNINCIGDALQAMGTPTLLLEAGHFQDDYQREETRKYIFIALLSSFISINENDLVDSKKEEYMNIPQNNPSFYDFVFKNIKINYESSKKCINFAAQYKEDLVDKTIVFNAFIVKIGNIDEFNGHVEFDASGKTYSNGNQSLLEINQKASFILDENTKIVNGKVILN